MRTVLHTESSHGHGGQEIRTLAEVRWLLGHDWGALIACQPDSPLLAEARASAIPVEAIRMRGATDVGAIVRLRRLMRESDVSIVHTHSSVDSWLAGVAAKSLGRPVVRTRHVSIPIGRRRALVYRCGLGGQRRCTLLELDQPARHLLDPERHRNHALRQPLLGPGEVIGKRAEPGRFGNRGRFHDCISL